MDLKIGNDMKIDLIIDGEVYLAEPYLGQEECLNCELKDICDNCASQPCRLYPNKVVFRKSISENNPKVFVKEYTSEQTVFLSSYISESGLPTMAKGALYKAGIKTFYDLLNELPSNVLRINHIGRKLLYLIKQEFENNGITWG